MKPSVKGSLVVLALHQLGDLVRKGVVDRSDVEAVLGEKWAELADSANVVASSWYPLALYDALLRLMLDKDGGGSPEYTIEQGRQAAEALTRMGVYPQLQRQGGVEAGFVRLLMSLSKAMYSFTRWELGGISPEEGWFEIVVHEAGHYPETLRWRNIGFLEVMTRHASGHPCSVASQRETPDRIRFRVRLQRP